MNPEKSSVCPASGYECRRSILPFFCFAAAGAKQCDGGSPPYFSWLDFFGLNQTAMLHMSVMSAGEMLLLTVRAATADRVGCGEAGLLKIGRCIFPSIA